MDRGAAGLQSTGSQRVRHDSVTEHALLGELRMRSLQNVYLPVTIRLQEATNITGVSLRWVVGGGMEVRG